MNIFTPEIIIKTPRTLRDRVNSFLDDQLNYTNEDKKYCLERFQYDLICNIQSEGATDDNLLLGLELNNYLRQINDPKARLVRISYNVEGV
ncbi:MAG: hypothetical protein GY861_26105 [bacterium]|nr:hypothetical protein [bacterium]